MHLVDRPIVRAVARMIFAASMAVTGIIAPPASAEVVRAVEYYHQAFEHYFVTANPAEIAALDSGVFQGWWRTGQRYRVDDAPGADLVPVCRFFTCGIRRQGVALLHRVGGRMRVREDDARLDL